MNTIISRIIWYR